jgi:hypothetical protein
MTAADTGEIRWAYGGSRHGGAVSRYRLREAQAAASCRRPQIARRQRAFGSDRARPVTGIVVETAKRGR